jgi:hypothetical protein
MRVLDARSRVPARRDRNGGGGAVVFLMMALVFAPILILHFVSLAGPAAAPAGADGHARGVLVAAPAHG